MLGCCLVSLYFLWGKLSTRTLYYVTLWLFRQCVEYLLRIQNCKTLKHEEKSRNTSKSNILHFFSLTNWQVCIIIETWGINMRLFLHTFALLQVLTPICNMWVDICGNITSSEVRQISHPSLPAFRDKLVCGRVQLNANNPRWLRAPSAAFLSVRAWSIICPRNHHHFYMPPCSSNLIKPLSRRVSSFTLMSSWN